MAPSTLHSRHVAAWLGFGISSRTYLRSEWITRHATQVQHVEPQEDCIFSVVNICVTFQRWILGFCYIECKECSSEVWQITSETPCL